MDEADEAEIDELIHNMYNPGCKKATEIYDILPLPDDELYIPTMIIINAHKEQTTPHDPDCFINRPPN
ncbi:MAG: hypothetical protein BWY76_01244 [bacterium ADurb.Bin429]|nr:MAG: hypothetical protein BWY76_01244 [bacterium ADurb.Bin429]